MNTTKSATKKATKAVTKKPAKSATKKTTKAVTRKPARSATKKSAKVRAAAPRTADEIFAEVEARAAEVGVELRDGATSREIARTEKALGLSLPDDIRAWYRRHDGSDGTDPFLWPLAQIRESRKHLEDLLEPHHFVLGGIEDSVSYIDLSPAGAGRIFHFTAETGPEATFDTFLEWLVSFDWDWDLG